MGTSGGALLTVQPGLYLQLDLVETALTK